MSTVLKLFLTIILNLVVLNGMVAAQNSLISQNQCLKNNQLILSELDPDDTLYRPLQQNQTGKGKVFSWMTKMKALNIKHAVGEVDFRMRDKKITLSVEKIRFYTKYYDFTSNLGLTNKDDLVAAQGLSDDLKLQFFAEALSLIEGVKVENNSCGKLYLNLLDDACLPILNQIPNINSNCIIP